jgi:hypothetical protein
MLGVTIGLKYVSPSDDYEEVLEMIGMLHHQLVIGFPDIKVETVIIHNLIEDEESFDGPKLESEVIDDAEVVDDETSEEE